MVNFLFWNLNKKPMQSVIRKLADLHNVHVFIFAECEITVADMLQTLNNPDNARYFYHPGECTKIHIYTTLGQNYVQVVRESDRFTIRRIYAPSTNDMLVVSAHFPSKLYWDDDSQATECVEIMKEIRLAEAQVGHDRTIVVGDFNMNPFEPGMVSANGFHAVMSRSVAQRKSRVVQNREYGFFYNPMWSFMGDISAGPSGTYYYENARHKLFFCSLPYRNICSTSSFSLQREKCYWNTQLFANSICECAEPALKETDVTATFPVELFNPSLLQRKDSKM